MTRMLGLSQGIEVFEHHYHDHPLLGIGPWTLNYTLLRGFGWLDGSLHGDVAVRRGLQLLLESDEKITEAEAQTWLVEFSPWRALVAAHLWAAKSTLAY